MSDFLFFFFFFEHNVFTFTLLCNSSGDYLQLWWCMCVKKRQILNRIIKSFWHTETNLIWQHHINTDLNTNIFKL